MIILILTYSLVLSFIFYLYVKYRHQYWQRQNIPYVEPEFFYGNTKHVDSKVHHTIFWKEIYQKLKNLGPVGGFYNYLDPVAIITDLDLLNTIFIKDFNYFTDRGVYHNIPQDPVSGHLINLEGEDWKFMRNKLSPAFSTGKLKHMLPVVDIKIDTLLSVMEKDMKATGQTEIRELISKYLSDVLGVTAFGIECRSMEDENSQFHKMARQALTGTQFKKKSLLESNRTLFQKLGIVASDQIAVKFYEGVVDEILRYRKTSNIQRNDFLGLMLDTKDSDREITRDEILAQSAVFLVGGHETQLTALSYAIYELSMNKEIQQKARDEVRKVVAKNKGKLLYEDIGELKYVEQCIYETLRKYFISFSARREVRKDYKVPNSNIVLKKGTLFQVPIFAIHNDPDIYPNPDVFDPDRFLPEEAEKRHSFAFIPFGEGPRLCIGKRFALLVTKATLARVLLNFEFTLDRSKTEVPLKIDPRILFVTPVDGIYVNLKKLD